MRHSLILLQGCKCIPNSFGNKIYPKWHNKMGIGFILIDLSGMTKIDAVCALIWYAWYSVRNADYSTYGRMCDKNCESASLNMCLIYLTIAHKT